MNRRVEQQSEQRDIALAHALETALEGGMEAGEQARAALCGAVMLALEQKADGDRGQGAREPIGSEHGEHDRKAERREQIFGRVLRGTRPR